jgi:hypothetical protein
MLAGGITSAYTENQCYRPLGIDAYGFCPYMATGEEGNTDHGIDNVVAAKMNRSLCHKTNLLHRGHRGAQSSPPYTVWTCVPLC